MGLLGTNGVGKTTTLKMITNLCSKDNGKIVIDNVSLDENPGRALASAGKKVKNILSCKITGLKNRI